MLTEVEVVSSRGSLLTMPLETVTDGIALVDVEGLDPVKATIVTSKNANMNGTQYHTSSDEDRNLKLKLLLEPDYATQTVEDVRHKLYTFFMPKLEVKLTFRTSTGLDVDIFGRVETCEAPLFTSEPAMDVSIICFDPYFVDPISAFLPGMTVSDSTEFTIDYVGTVDTGINFYLELDRALTEFTIYNTTPDGVVRSLDFSAPMESGGLLAINTVPGQKAVDYAIDGVHTSLLYGVSPQSTWIYLQPGINTLRVYAEGAGIPTVITYFTRYGGL